MLCLITLKYSDDDMADGGGLNFNLFASQGLFVIEQANFTNEQGAGRRRSGGTSKKQADS
jgi:hypothetical protein